MAHTTHDYVVVKEEPQGNGKIKYYLECSDPSCSEKYSYVL